MNKRFCHDSFYAWFFFFFCSQFSLVDNFTLAWNGDLGQLPLRAHYRCDQKAAASHLSSIKVKSHFLLFAPLRCHQICQSSNNKSADEAPKRLNTRKNCSWWVCRDKICSILSESVCVCVSVCAPECECVWQSRKLSMNKWNNAHFGLMFGFNFDVWHMIGFCVLYTDLSLSKSTQCSANFMELWLYE